ncbi:hypothetical protein Patl1_11421 [Pistacia atlantica]|uniref:Uncharacterized protein n=1 Tax=Pistacia atlantica TaxID=434234 RepID=A0ACC1A6X4_9ROSI|nr:hypothetical protein Patl1_11421 [Pistacia atlantica]
MTFLIAVDTICKQVADKVYLSKTSLCQLQQQKEFQGETEDMVIMNCIEGLKEEFEERLGDQSPRFYDDEQLSWFEKKNKELSSLRQQLDAIFKSLSFPEIGHISSHGSMEIGEECNNNKRTDHLHRKVSGASLWEGIGQHDESEIAVPENLDYGQLQHMTKEALVSYFKTQMTNMKRNHELKVQEMTEENISLKRKCLRERGSSLPFKTDKEFDTLRKKIAEVILKLDDNLSDNRHTLLPRKSLVKRIEHLQSALVDACFEASIKEDVYKCLLRGVVNSNSSVTELSDIESSSKYDFEDSAMESIIRQELCGVIFKESLKEAKEKLFDLNLKYTNEHELRVHVETEALQKEEALSLEVSEKEKLKQQTCLLSSLMEENGQSSQGSSSCICEREGAI